jgi:HEAT repeat protein
LNELEAPVSDELLARALADVSTDVRESAAQLAGERQMIGVVPQLIRMLDDRSSGPRESAAHALTEMRTPPAHEALRRALTHRDASVRRIAVEYFGEEVDK